MTNILGAPVRRFSAIDSTNLEAARVAEQGERGPLWLVANKQMAGRGRLGRAWQSPRGNLYATLLLPLEVGMAALPQLGFVVALAVHDTVGCGINVAAAPQGLPYPATALRYHGVADANGVFETYRRRLAKRLAQWDEGFASIASDWQARAIGMGETITVSHMGQETTGTFLGLADDGAMRLSTISGERLIRAGDVTIPSLVRLRETA